jgi:hypothetical protein
VHTERERREGGGGGGRKYTPDHNYAYGKTKCAVDSPRYEN